MSRYSTRFSMRRTYKWKGQPSSDDRKMRRVYYKSLTISVEGRPESWTVSLGQFILIEGDDDDNPYVAQLLKLYSDDSEKKTAVLQWYVRMCEVPQNKRKLLGRDPHPQEIFYYKSQSCDNEVDAETILASVQVKHLPVSDPFPESKKNNTLYVKLFWDTKAFQELSAEMMQRPESPKTPPPAEQKPRARALPTPDPVVMKKAALGACTRGSMSTGKMTSTEAESLHSASKLSASKALSAKRRGRAASGPHVRKKLDLYSPTKNMTREDVLGEILDEDVPTKRPMTSKLNMSPTGRMTISIRLTPLLNAEERLSQLSIPEKATPENKTTAISVIHGVESLEDDEPEILMNMGRTPRRREATPRRASLRGLKTQTPSRRKDSAALKEPSLASLTEEEHEDSPIQTTLTPRSKRKSAQLVSSRIKQQMTLLKGKADLLSDDEDGEDDDCFVPATIDLQSSSEEEVDAKLDSDDDLLIKKRRSSSRATVRTPRKTPSKRSAPATPRTPRHATPSIPSRIAPARTPGNVLEEARARLHVSSVPESLPCREQEFQDIYNFVESKVFDGTGGCMYISGVPGTGKTATVHEVIRCLQQAADQDEIPHFRFIEINGMKMTDPHQAYVQILQKLTDQKATPDHAAALLEKRFSAPAPKKETTVLLVDELDLLWTRKQNVMYNLFDWPTRRNARLVVLTIANTMDLPERIMINRVASRLGLTRMSFQPYTFKQLQQIMASRLNQVKAFEEDALQLVSRKVAALSGDARRCLDICRRATEICEQSASQKKKSGLVGMSHVTEAMDEMFSSSYISAIRCASLQEQLFLRSVIAEFRRLGLEEATFQQVFVQHQALCRVEGLQPVSVSEGLAICQRLGSCRLLLLEGSRLDLLIRVRLNVSQDDVLFALKRD